MAEETSKPTPDPTILTTEQLERAIKNLSDLFDAKLGEQIAPIKTELHLVELHRVEQKSDTKAAVDAALTAQKEAVKEQTTASERAQLKSETATGEQLRQLTVTFNTTIAALNSRIDELKERLDRGTGGSDQSAKWLAAMFSTLALIAAVAAIVVSAKP
jgi:hypothetical protein